jgi:hypothetical protein
VYQFATTIGAKGHLGAFVKSFQLIDNFPPGQDDITIDQIVAFAKSYKGKVEVIEAREYVTLSTE